MRQFVWVLVSLLSVCSALLCPDGGMCDDGNTCCQTPSGGYGCCPLPNAECCSDHLHCCYEGTLCDLEHAKCVNKTHTLNMVRRVAAKQSSLPQAVVCPDQESECPDETTCCQMPDGSWGCCPMPDAVCCEDKMHCCPQGTKCDLAHSKCMPSMHSSIPLLKKFPANRKAPEANGADVSAEQRSLKFPDSNDVVCSDKKSTCPDDTTCCKLGNGSYGCCPLPNAVCCSDLVHCCPEGTTCDLVHSTCVVASESSTKAIKIQSIQQLKMKDPVPCNETVSCESGSTCCKKQDGNWGCCPLLKAVCCEDHLHCCPHDTICNVAAGTCDSATDTGSHLAVPWMSKKPAVAMAAQNDRCDETSVCPVGTTCCKQKSGAWACCPLPKAVCCDDHEHCCPQGYKCDIAQESCDHSTLPSIPWVKKNPALKTIPSSDTDANDVNSESALKHDQKCDEHTSCPRGSTCCFMKNFRKWGCCPLPQAVCCENGEHCCPKGYNCDKDNAFCVKGKHQIPWFKKQPAHVTKGTEVMNAVGNVKCDETTTCAAGSTCCKLLTGQWGCCPLIKAVCCDDHIHCCPEGYTCDLKGGTCNKPSSTHTVALALVHTHSGDEEVRCDETSHCSSTETCCRLSVNEWACCPLKQAVCCKDMKHCCPMGYTCDSERGCIQRSPLTWWENSL
ncbi:granulin b [Trichomycterus rosablanca]|uniref:granulin b n=1 Tax=Trichomycterus rosablanca TaxID=2290929 RepID=UPI002F35C4DC